MAEMLHAILDISRIEAGAITPKKTSFPLQSLLHKLEAALGPVADAKQLTYRSRETNYSVLSDPVLLEQILRNVIVNAINYSRYGGVLIGCRRRGDEVQIEVWDTGIGIAEDQIENIFQEFFQGDNPERDRRKGFGLGLSIVKGLANSLSHQYSFYSELGRGSCFRISVPLGTAIASEEHSREVIVQPEQMAKRILVIDDDETVRESIDILLSSWGCICDIADSAASATRLARENCPDLIISDYRLRDYKTGMQAIQELREILGEPIPALIITGDTSPERLHELMSTHIPVMHKPVSAQQLYNAIVQVTASPAPDTAVLH